ncbi:MAG: small, acid-soluble spore protein, alpha/beta type [Peptostreptococcaceae bacterium]
MDNNKLTKELIEKCEKTKKGATKKSKPLTDNDIMKYEIASELGLLDKVSERGWAGLTAKEAGKIGGILTSRKKQKKKMMEDANKDDGAVQ